ncbi:MAG: MFS transporter, partial [Sphingomonadales bacterium]|nr:MFS transporter [Sphingomonadales bacterium]
LTPFRKPTFVFACAFNLVIGFGLYAGTYLIPLFLGRVRGYNASEIGSTVVIAGCAQLLGVPIAASLSQRVDQRIVITFGLALFALGLWLFSAMTPDWGFAALFWPQVVRSFAVMLCIVPSVGLALGNFEGPELRYASSLFNLMRNAGGAVGIALANTWLADNTRIHALRLSEALGQSAKAANDTAAALAHELSAVTPDSAQALLMYSRTRGIDPGVRRRVPPDGLSVPRSVSDGPVLPTTARWRRAATGCALKSGGWPAAQQGSSVRSGRARGSASPDDRPPRRVRR